MNSDDTHLDAAINETPKRGPFLSSADTKRTWQCPFCDHSLRYSATTRDVAEMAANSHVSRQHKGENVIVILPDAERTTQRESSQDSREDSPRQR
jgi:hypothetical protein